MSQEVQQKSQGGLRWALSNGFLLGLASVLIAAWLVPGPGSDGGFLQPDWSVKAAVFVIFLNSGLTLPISTAVVMSTSARGDASAALFNVTASNILGVLIVPAVCVHLVGDRAGTIDGGAMMLRTVSTILPPLILGMLIRPFVYKTVDAVKKQLGRVNNALILFICYVSFAQSVTDETWQRLGVAQISTTIAISALLVALLMVASWGCLRALRFHEPLAIAGFFCSTQKTLAAGVPMALAIFTPLGIHAGPVLAPLLCFYAISLAVSGLVVNQLKGCSEA